MSLRIANKPPLELKEKEHEMNDEIKDDVDYLQKTSQLANQATSRIEANLKFSVYRQLKFKKENPIGGLYSFYYSSSDFNQYLHEGNEWFEKDLTKTKTK